MPSQPSPLEDTLVSDLRILRSGTPGAAAADMFEPSDEEVWLLREDGTLEMSSGAQTAPVCWWDAVAQHLGTQDCCALPLTSVGIEVRAQRVRAVGTGPLASTRIVARVRALSPTPEVGITARQREVSEYAAHGATVAEIASHLGISLHTVRSHLKSTYRVLGVANRLELARALGTVYAG